MLTDAQLDDERKKEKKRRRSQNTVLTPTPLQNPPHNPQRSGGMREYNRSMTLKKGIRSKLNESERI
jgi:hypothetical protein